ncbi:MAG: MCE family protein [Taibaiella sp.]|nr:MCE family protein [Taibaiella sp.]
MRKKTTVQNITLGVFVTAGLVILVVSLYLVGKNQNMFGSSFHLRARFRNISGLQAGNNVRFSGIQAGTVGKITVIDDTSIEVDLLVNEEMKPFIRDNSLVSIGNEGLMGNKVVNITPSRLPGNPARDNSLLHTKPDVNTDQMMEAFSTVGDNVEIISGGLVSTVNRINESNALWHILNDTVMTQELHLAVINLRIASGNINQLTLALSDVVKDAQAGKGAAGAIIADTAVAGDLRAAMANVRNMSEQSAVLLRHLDSLVGTIQNNIDKGDGLAHAMLHDSSMTGRVSRSLLQVENGTASFNEAMTALKHNVLLRGYFRKVEKRKKGSGQRDSSLIAN